MNRPPWLDEEREIQALLHAFADRLDRQEADDAALLKSIRIDKKRLPRLCRHDTEADTTWALLQSLTDSLVTLRLNPKRKPHEADYAGASAALKPGAESILRDWLGRPRRIPYATRWREALEQHAERFADGGALSRPIEIEGREAGEVVTAFAAIGDHLDAGLTLRQLSARCFWGHSKFLDSREELLSMLFPSLSLAGRPVMVNIHLPENIGGVLFIENQDSYTQSLASAEAANLAIIYAAGFRGSAKRIREKSGASLHYHTDSSPLPHAKFEQWWFSADAAPWPVWFWGDLDYAGLAILKALRSRFGDVRAWQPGYQPMLNRLAEGHRAMNAGKEEQSDPGSTGCPYADEVLLPAIRQWGRFLDQEAV